MLTISSGSARAFIAHTPRGTRAQISLQAAAAAAGYYKFISALELQSQLQLPLCLLPPHAAAALLANNEMST